MIGFPRMAATVLLTIAMSGSPSAGVGQLVARASYVDDGSFALSSSTSEAPREPVALATDSQGRIHIADRQGSVYVLARDGSFEGSYGTAALERPLSLAFDEHDRAYVLDEDSKLVLVFGDGELQYSIGAGDGPARLRDPVDVAVGPGGFVYVLDESGPAIQIFGRDGVYVRRIDLQPAIQNPVTVDVDGDGTLLLASRSLPGRIFFIRPFFELPWNGVSTPTGMDIGAEGEPISVVSDGRGTAVLLDAKEGRLWGGQRIDSDAGLIARPIYGGQGTGRGSFRRPVDVAFTPERDLLILDGELRKIERIALAETERTEALAFEFPVRVGQMPPDLEQGAVIEVSGPRQSTLRLAFTVNRGRDLLMAEAEATRWTDSYRRSFQAFVPEADPGSVDFRRTLEDAPGDIAFNDTLLVIAEPDEDRFSVFDLRSGATLGAYGDNYGDDRRLRDPSSVALLSDGSIVVADRGNDRVAVFSPDLASLIAEFPLLEVDGVAVSPGDRLFAWDETGEVVVEIPTDGSPRQRLQGALVPGPVEDIDFDPSGNLFVLEVETSRVTVVSADLDRIFVRFGGRDPDFEADFISVDGAGNVYVGSTERERTAVYRWDLALPELTGVAVTLTSSGITARWTPIDSPFLDGYRVLASESSRGPFEPIASTDESSISVEIDPERAYRWVGVAPATIAGTTTGMSPLIRLAHLELRAAHEEGDPGMVMGYMQYLDSVSTAGAVRVGDDVVQELNWRALDAEVEQGYYEEAVAREVVLEGWTGDDNGYSLHRRLAEAHAARGSQEEVLEHAKAALEALPADARGGDEELALMEATVEAAAAVGDYQTVATVGERLRDRVDPDDRYRLLSRIAEARLHVGQPAVALAMADDLTQTSLNGDIGVFGDEPGELAWTALRAAIRLDDAEAVERWREAASNNLTGDRLSRYHSLIGAYELRQGNVEGARGSLNYLAVLQDADAFRDPSTVELSLGVYRALQEQDRQNRTQGLQFLTDYMARLPDEAEALREMYADSLAVFRVREDTRAKLGPGFEAWESANFGALVSFFESVLSNDVDLTLEQQLLARSLLAGGYIVVDRPDAAREEILTILTLDPDLDPQQTNADAESAYGVRPFDASLAQLLIQIRGGA